MQTVWLNAVNVNKRFITRFYNTFFEESGLVFFEDYNKTCLR